MFRLKKIELFTSIDEMPVYNWFKIHQTNDLTLLVKSGKSETKKHSELLIANWDSLLSEFIDTFGVSETFKKIIRLRFSIETKKFQVIHTGDKSANTFIKLEQIELDKLTRHEPKKHLQDMASQKVAIERLLNRRVNERETTVKEYYEYLQELQKVS